MNPLLNFIDFSDKEYNTKFYAVEDIETKERLGVIKWSPTKMEYIYSPNKSAYFTAAMLIEICKFMNSLNIKS